MYAHARRQVRVHRFGEQMDLVAPAEELVDQPYGIDLRAAAADIESFDGDCDAHGRIGSRSRLACPPKTRYSIRVPKTVGWWRRATSRYRKLPDFLIIGAQRSGTSTLYQYIARHPDVRGAFRKEVHYFDMHYDRGLDWYRACFPTRGFTGESSPSYLIHPEVPARVAAVLPDIKLIAILRNPVERAYSAYNRNVRR